MARDSALPAHGAPDVRTFGAFELNITTGELRKHGLRLRLQNQPLKVLEVLTSQPGRLFSREDLTAQVWPDGTFVDFDHGLNTAVNRLRQALGDSAENPRYVETIAGRGYRFIAPVQQPVPREPVRLQTVWKPWLLACSATLAIASVGYFYEAGSSVSSFTSLPLTAEPGWEIQPSLSPDGNRVAFSYSKSGSSDYDIYIKTIGSDGMVVLKFGPAQELSPAWSPDGRSIAFIRISDQTATVVQTPVDGGPERHIGEISLSWFEQRPSTFGNLLAWSPDGRWVATSSSRRPYETAGIVMISVLTGEVRWVTEPPSTTGGDFSPSYSPDGERLTFARYLSFTVADIYVANVPRDAVELGEAKRLTFFDRLAISPIWASSGKEILFSCDCSSHQRRFWRIPASVAKAKAIPVEGVGENSVSLSLSARHRRLVYGTQTKDTNIWRISLGQRPEKDAKTSPVIASTHLDNTPDYSPDGRQIAYQSERSGRDEIWVANSDGSSSRQLTRLNARVSGFPRWSPDAQSLVFHSRVDGWANLFIVNVATGALRRLTQGTGQNIAPTWSRNGNWIYFGSRRTGQYQIWKIPQAGGEAVQVTRNGGLLGFESFDGTQLIHSKPEDGAVWALDLKTGTESRIAENATDWSTFATARSGVYVLSNPNSESLRFLDLIRYHTGEVIRLTELSSRVDLGLSVAPDEASVLYTQVDDTGADLNLVEQFH